MRYRFAHPGATKDLSGANLFILLLFSCLTGIVLTGFSWLRDRLCFFFFMRSDFTIDYLGLRKDGPFAEQWTVVGRNMGDVIIVSADGAKNLVKGLAKVALCENLLTALVVLAVLGFASSAVWFYAPAQHALVGAPLSFDIRLIKGGNNECKLYID